MNQNEFIKKMLVKFMSNADETLAQQTREDFEKYLPATLDYDFLYDNVIKNYKMKSMPEIAWLKDYFRTAREYKPYDSGLTWTALIRTNLGDYEIAIEMKYTEQEVINAYRKKLGWQYISGNRREVRIRNGLA